MLCQELECRNVSFLLFYVFPNIAWHSIENGIALYFLQETYSLKESQEVVIGILNRVECFVTSKILEICNNEF